MSAVGGLDDLRPGSLTSVPLPSDNVRAGVLVVRLIWQGVRHARGRAVALAAGMLVAAVAVSLLTAAVVVNAATIRGDVSSNWRGAYDLLVLPAGSAGSAG